MRESSNFKIGLRFAVLGILAICLWQFASSVPAQETAQGYKKMSVETHQLPSESGMIPIELKCGQAQLSAPDTIEDVPCVIRNNTNKLVKAVGVTKSVTTEKNGETSTASSSIVIDAFVHPDINLERGGKLIPPGKEINAGGLPTDYNSIVKGVSLTVDYVEFDDGTELGPNAASCRQKIADIRSGAAKYKKWLSQQFNRHARDVNELIPLLEREPSPEEIGIGNDNEAEGASLYKSYANKVKGEKGVYVLAERLK